MQMRTFRKTGKTRVNKGFQKGPQYLPTMLASRPGYSRSTVLPFLERVRPFVRRCLTFLWVISFGAVEDMSDNGPDGVAWSGKGHTILRK